MNNIFYRCKKCSDKQDAEGISELKEWGERFWFDEKTKYYICPDCWDDINRRNAEEQLEELLNE